MFNDVPFFYLDTCFIGTYNLFLPFSTLVLFALLNTYLYQIRKEELAKAEFR